MVHGVAEEENADGDGEADAKGDEENHSLAWRGRHVGTRGRLDDACVPSGVGFGEFVLFTFLEEVDVE